MWIYRQGKVMLEQGAESYKMTEVYQVGYLNLVGVEFNHRQTGASETQFEMIEEYTTRDEAREAVNFLNGGSPMVRVTGTVDIGTTGV